MTDRLTALLQHLRQHGLRATWRRIQERLFPGKEPQWVTEVRAIDAAFDQLHHVQTGGITQLGELSISSDNRSHGVPYVAIRPDEFDAAFAALALDTQRFTFVDVGSGKGRALILAARHPFARLIGVEFARELHDMAQNNLRALGITAETLCMDAAQYTFPDGPLLIFLYNPFGPAVMDKVAQHASLASGPVYVLYLNPFHEKCWLDNGFSKVHSGAHFSILTLQR